MSRIEEALKKTVRAREEAQGGEFGVVAAATEPKTKPSPKPSEPVPPQPLSLLEVEPLELTNKLLVTALEERTAAAEEFNKLRASVVALTRGEPFLNTLMITSGVSEEGKSMTALNLAVSLAKEQDHTVLLVDTDLRRPSLHRYLGINPKKGWCIACVTIFRFQRY